MAKFQVNHNKKNLSWISVIGLLAVLIGCLTGMTWLTVTGVVIIVAPFALLAIGFILMAILAVIIAVSEDGDKK